jgi:hypothetical protein
LRKNGATSPMNPKVLSSCAAQFLHLFKLCPQAAT